MFIFLSAFVSPDHQAAAAADQGPFPGLPQRRHADCGRRGVHQRRAELHRGTGDTCAVRQNRPRPLCSVRTLFSNRLSFPVAIPVASPRRAASRRQSVKMVAEAFRCVDYESQ